MNSHCNVWGNKRRNRHPPAPVSLYHLAYVVSDRQSFVEAFKALEAAGIVTVLVNHLISWAIDFSDPDGNRIEIFWDTRDELGGQTLWRGRNLALPAQRFM